MGSPGQFDRVAMNISMYIRWFGLDMKKQMGKAHDMYVFLYISCAFRSYVPSRRRTELCTIEANSFFCSEIGYFQESGNRNTESAIVYKYDLAEVFARELCSGNCGLLMYQECL